MLKKISVWLLCVACLLTAATAALAEGETSEEPDAVISDEEPLPSEEPPAPTESEDDFALLSVWISTVFTDDALTVTVFDEQGEPVPNAPLAFDVDSTLNLLTAFTAADGTASLSIVGLDPGTVIICHTAEFSAETTTYLSAEVTVVVPGEVPTTTTADETPTTETDPPVTAPTAVTTMAPLPTLPPEDVTGTTRSMPSYAEMRGATTTRVLGDEVYTNLLIDEHLLEQFGCSMTAFDGSGRLILDRAAYARLTDAYGSHLFGKLTTSVLSDVTADQIRTAKQGVPELADSKAENALALTFAASLQFLEDNGTGLPVTDASSLGSDLMFTFELPVPKSMEHCKSFGIAMTGENVLNPLTPVAANNGVISFRTPALGHFTLVGFTDGTSFSGGSSLSTIMWLLIGLGVLILGLMAFLIYRFFFHDRGDDPDDPNGDDGFGGDNPGGDQPDGGDKADADPAEDDPDAPADADDPSLLAADGTPLDVEALKQSWIEEDKQVQAILRDVKRSKR